MSFPWQIPPGENYTRVLLTTTVCSILAHGLILGLLALSQPAPHIAFQKDEGISIELANLPPAPRIAPAMLQQKPQPIEPEPAQPAAPPKAIRVPAQAKPAQKTGRKKGDTGVTRAAAANSATAGPAGAEHFSNQAPVTVSSNPAPPYPELARKRGQTGMVRIRCQVNDTGYVTAASIAASSGHKLLDDAALKTVKKWRFRPAVSNGAPVSGVVVVPVEFRLR